MIPESKFYTPQVSRSGKYIYYRFPTKWTTGETCAIEPTKSGAGNHVPGDSRACPEAKLERRVYRFMRAKVAEGYSLSAISTRPARRPAWKLYGGMRNERVQD